MARKLQHLYLHIAQLKIEGDNALTKSYHSSKVKDFIQENNRLIEHVLSRYDDNVLKLNIHFFYNLFSFIDECHSFIVSSTTEDVRSEIFTCLRFVLKDWIPDPEQYVIICSQGNYAFRSYTWGDDDIYDHIESKLHFKYAMKMIPIYMPFHMKNDFLFNASLYHEIGHFIDHYHKITDLIIEEVKNGALDIPQKDVYLKDMTTDITTDSVKYYKQLSKFIGEYLADLFCAQYLGKSMFQFLNYFDPIGNADEEHASNKDREDLVDMFLGDSKNYDAFLKMLLDHVKTRSTKVLAPIKLNTDISSFVHKTECDKPESEQHVHSIIPNLWEIWNNRRDEFKNPDGSPMHFIDIYRTLMELTAKTVQKMQ